MTGVAFGEFSLDTGTRELLRSGQRVHLSPKAYELLTILVENRPRALPKSELQRQLWPDTFVVEANVANLVGEIREALGDDPRRPRYLRTVHRFGYAFQAAVAAGGVVAIPRIVYRLTWKGGRATLGEGEHVLGRAPDVAVVLRSPSVSRRHARIVVDGVGATIEDLGSKNGTFLGDGRVKAPERLDDGNKIRLGTVGLTFRILAPAPSTQTGAPWDPSDP